jgi:hypothetical protein
MDSGMGLGFHPYLESSAYGKRLMACGERDGWVYRKLISLLLWSFLTSESEY